MNEIETLHYESAGAVSKSRQERRREREEAHRQELRELVAAGVLTQEEAKERGL